MARQSYTERIWDGGGCGARTALDEGPLHFVVLCVALLCDNGFVFGVTVMVFGLLVCMQVCVHAAGGDY